MRFGSSIDWHTFDIIESRPVIPKRQNWKFQMRRGSTTKRREKKANRLCIAAPSVFCREARCCKLIFISETPERSRKILLQIYELQRRYPEGLVKLASLAANGRETELAEQCWCQAIALESEYARDVVAFVVRFPEVRLKHCVCGSQQAIRIATRAFLDDVDKSPPLTRQVDDYLNWVATNIECRGAKSRVEQARCHDVLADAFTKLGRFDDAIQSYRMASQCLPGNVSRRAKLITKLRSLGRLDAAIDEAKQASEEMPSEALFAGMVREMMQVRKQNQENSQ